MTEEEEKEEEKEVGGGVAGRADRKKNPQIGKRAKRWW